MSNAKDNLLFLIEEYMPPSSAVTAKEALAAIEADRVSRDVPAGYVKASESMDVRRLYATLCDVVDEANAVDTVIGRPQVLYEKLRRLRDEIGSATNCQIPLAASPQPQPVQEAPRGGNICLDCANADSWGVPDKRICQDCNMNSQWQPLNKSSKNPIQQTPHAAQPSEQAQPSEMQDTAETLLPHAYLFEKLAMVMPLFQEARDALTAIREDQRIRHGISATLADRMDAAGTFSLDDWMNAQPKPAEQEQQEE